MLITYSFDCTPTKYTFVLDKYRFYLLQDSAHVSRLERLSDAVIHLESFAGSDKEQNPLYRDYHGTPHSSHFNCVTTCSYLVFIIVVSQLNTLLICLQACFIFAKSHTLILWSVIFQRQWTWHSSWKRRSFWSRYVFTWIPSINICKRLHWLEHE